jgi:hypothetical protein
VKANQLRTSRHGSDEVHGRLTYDRIFNWGYLGRAGKQSGTVRDAEPGQDRFKRDYVAVSFWQH